MTISGVPTNWTLSDSLSAPTNLGNGAWTVAPDALASLAILAPAGGFNQGTVALTVTASNLDTDDTETETLSTSSSLTVTINPRSTPILDMRTNAMLKVDHAADFSGAVAGFDGSDVLDLADVAFGKNTTLGYAANSSNTGGTLTVSDGAHTANITLLGQYMAGSFVMSADGFGGTHIQDPPPATLMLTHSQHA